MWLFNLIDMVNKGKNVVVPCNNARVATAIHTVLTQACADKKIMLYTQTANVCQREQDVRDVDESWLRYNVLIYSPTVSAGISFEKKHFDLLFGYYDIGVTTLETFF